MTLDVLTKSRFHAAALIIDNMGSRSRRFWLLATVVLIVPLAFVLYPVSRVVEGVGTIEPLFEDLILITTDVSGMVTHVFDRGAGMSRATEEGEPIPSAVAGQVYSLGITQRSQFSGAAARARS